MEDYQKRVVAEKMELDERLEKLSDFIRGNIFSGLDADEKNRLRYQLLAMQLYSNILSDRIVAFADDACTKES